MLGSSSKTLLKSINEYLPTEQAGAVKDALDYAIKVHDGQKRDSGEPFVEHPIATALRLADMRLDTTTIQAALLHDVIEDCGINFQQIEAKFGTDVAKLVDGVTKLKRLDQLPENSAMIRQITSSETTRAASLRKMLVAMAEDVRVVLIKLSDRLHNMQTLQYLPAPRRQRISRETLDIYSPLAHRLGMSELKWQLED
ncbi:MAG: HD domain-containing protein, partial [Arenicellales bacterium]|nr:HD domain-containing protein [Arenicellales bacterium]